VLSQGNNSPRVDMSLHSDTLSGFRANQSLLFLLNNVVCLAEKQNLQIVYGLTQQRLESKIYHTRGEHGNHFPTHAVPPGNREDYSNSIFNT
jgi:hypothetical protein